MEPSEVEMDYKRGISVGLKQSSINDLDRLYIILDKSSRSELCREALENYLSQKKIRELLIKN